MEPLGSSEQSIQGCLEKLKCILKGVKLHKLLSRQLSLNGEASVALCRLAWGAELPRVAPVLVPCCLPRHLLSWAPGAPGSLLPLLNGAVLLLCLFSLL